MEQAARAQEWLEKEQAELQQRRQWYQKNQVRAHQSLAALWTTKGLAPITNEFIAIRWDTAVVVFKLA